MYKNMIPAEVIAKKAALSRERALNERSRSSPGVSSDESNPAKGVVNDPNCCNASEYSKNIQQENAQHGQDSSI